MKEHILFEYEPRFVYRNESRVSLPETRLRFKNKTNTPEIMQRTFDQFIRYCLGKAGGNLEKTRMSFGYTLLCFFQRKNVLFLDFSTKDSTKLKVFGSMKGRIKPSMDRCCLMNWNALLNLKKEWTLMIHLLFTCTSLIHLKEEHVEKTQLVKKFKH